MMGGVTLSEPAGARDLRISDRRLREDRSRDRWLDPLLLGFVAAAVSALGSWIPSKWNDEAATQTAASRTLPQLWTMIHTIDAVHAAYYAFMHFWIEAFGTSNLALRTPSILAVGLACAGVVVLGKRIGSRRIAVCAAIVFMILPRVTWMGIEARSSAVTAAASVWLTIVLLAAIEERTSARRTRWWMLYLIVGAAGIVINLYLVLVIIAHGITLLLSRRRLSQPRRLLARWGIASGIAAVLASPLIFLSIAQDHQLPFGPLTVVGVVNKLWLEQYFVGATPTYFRSVPIPPTYLWSYAAIVLASIGWALIVAPIVFRRLRPTLRDGDTIELVRLTAPWIFLPIIVLIGYSLVAHPIYTARYLAFTTPAAALLIGASIAALRVRWQRFAALAAIAAIALPIYVSQRGPTAKNDTDWQQAAAIIQRHAKPGEDVYFGREHSRVSIGRGTIAQAYPASVADLHDITLRRTGAQRGTLWNSHWPLTHAHTELATAKVLWAVLEHYGRPSPAWSVRKKALESGGLHLARIWRGPTTDVLLFTR